MAKGLVNESSLNSIAEAINVLNGTEGTYTPSEMGEAILDAIPTETASGNPIHITDAAAYPVDSCVTTLEPVQEGSGDPSPENVRPITGYTGVELTRTGKNLMPITAESQTKNDVTFTANKDNAGNVISVTVNGTASADTTYLLITNTVFTSTGNDIILSGCPANGSQSSGHALGLVNEATYGVLWDIGSGETIHSYKSSQNRVIIRIASGYTANNLVFYPMIRLASDTDPTYEPYRGETHSITFPQAQSPVYGGEVDWVNGVLRVTNVKTILDGKNNIVSNGSTSGEGTVYQAEWSAYRSIGVPSAIYISDKFKTVATSDKAPYTIYSSSDGVSIRMFLAFPTTITSTTDANAWLNENNVEVVYPLATPIEIPLTPEIITLLKGENNIWTDAGTSEIEYTVDLQTYIQKLINEASVNASNLSVSPLSLGKSAIEPESETEDEAEGKPTELLVEEDTEAEPTEEEPDTLEKEDGDTV